MVGAVAQLCGKVDAGKRYGAELLMAAGGRGGREMGRGDGRAGKRGEERRGRLL